MPDIVKACYNAMHRFSDGHPVILITEKNYKDYVNKLKDFDNSFDSWMQNGGKQNG